MFIPDIRFKTKTRRIQIGFRTVDANVQCSEINHCLKCNQYNGEEEITEITTVTCIQRFRKIHVTSKIWSLKIKVLMMKIMITEMLTLTSMQAILTAQR